MMEEDSESHHASPQTATTDLPEQSSKSGSSDGSDSLATLGQASRATLTPLPHLPSEIIAKILCFTIPGFQNHPDQTIEYDDAKKLARFFCLSKDIRSRIKNQRMRILKIPFETLQNVITTFPYVTLGCEAYPSAAITQFPAQSCLERTVEIALNCTHLSSDDCHQILQRLPALKKLTLDSLKVFRFNDIMLPQTLEKLTIINLQLIDEEEMVAAHNLNGLALPKNLRELNLVDLKKVSCFEGLNIPNYPNLITLCLESFPLIDNFQSLNLPESKNLAALKLKNFPAIDTFVSFSAPENLTSLHLEGFPLVEDFITLEIWRHQKLTAIKIDNFPRVTSGGTLFLPIRRSIRCEGSFFSPPLSE
jgi:hypothetical protein